MAIFSFSVTRSRAWHYYHQHSEHFQTSFLSVWHKTLREGAVLSVSEIRKLLGLPFGNLVPCKVSKNPWRFFSHCFLYVNALIMRGSPQCCTCSYSVDQWEVLLSSFTFSVSWWLCLANKLWSLRISDDNAGSSASYRMQFLFLLNLQHKQNIFSQAVEKLCGIYYLTKSMKTSEHLPFANIVYPLLTRPKSKRVHLKVKPKWSSLIWLLRM